MWLGGQKEARAEVLTCGLRIVIMRREKWKKKYGEAKKRVFWRRGRRKMFGRRDEKVTKRGQENRSSAQM
jgi:hypothetical protein